MTQRTLHDKLAILSDAAKYDASCASSGGEKRDARAGGLGSSGGSGICHAYTPDGRCISLLKILMTNFCIFDCAYCINRVSSNVERARFSVEEVVSLTLEFYRRNYIEDHGFHGYIHLKTIPDAASELIHEAGLWADRLSINVELPLDQSVRQLAPEKRPETIRAVMAQVRLEREAAKDTTHTGRKPRAFAPAGQSTQMIIGADGSDDVTILNSVTRLYSGYKLKRVYYSAFSPIPDASAALPLVKPPLMREHRLYQADWLLRFYGFTAEEIATGAQKGHLDLELDPKLAWALQHRGLFPMDVNRAARDLLLRVPGFGVRTVDRIIADRRNRMLRYDDLVRMGAMIRKARPFISLPGWTPAGLTDSADLRARFAPPPQQLSLL